MSGRQAIDLWILTVLFMQWRFKRRSITLWIFPLLYPLFRRLLQIWTYSFKIRLGKVKHLKNKRIDYLSVQVGFLYSEWAKRPFDRRDTRTSRKGRGELLDTKHWQCISVLRSHKIRCKSAPVKIEISLKIILSLTF